MKVLSFSFPLLLAKMDGIVSNNRVSSKNCPNHIFWCFWSCKRDSSAGKYVACKYWIASVVYNLARLLINWLYIFFRCTQNFKFFLHWCPLARLIFFVIVNKMLRKEPGPLLIFLLTTFTKIFTLLIPNTAGDPLVAWFKICQMGIQG